jgi:hypothetical protein
MIIASDIISSGNYNPTPSLLNSVLINIYELSGTQPIAHPTHFLSSWAEAKSPSPTVHPSRPFQFKPPTEAIYLNPDKPKYLIAQPIYHFNPSYCSTPASPYHLLSTSNHHHTRPIQLQPNPFHPLTQPFQLSPNPALLSINPYSRTNRKSPRSSPTTRFHPYYIINSNPSSPPVPSINSPDDSHHSTPLKRGWTSVNELPFAPLKKTSPITAGLITVDMKTVFPIRRSSRAVQGSTILISAGLASLLGTVNQPACVHGSPPLRALIRKTSVPIVKSKEVSRTWKRKSKGVEGVSISAVVHKRHHEDLQLSLSAIQGSGFKKFKLEDIPSDMLAMAAADDQPRLPQ